MNKQTAVEWLIEQYENGINTIQVDQIAKEMEKEQIEWAYLQAYNDCLLGRLSDSENYYQHHYGI